MIKGIQLTLMIGPGIPLPVPRVVLDALVSVQVKCTTGVRIDDTEGEENEDPRYDEGGFELVFRLDKRSPLQTLFLVSGGVATKFVRVMLLATINGTPEVLIDGMMTHHQVNPGQGGEATLTVQGMDLSVVMTYFDISGVPYPCMPPVARVALIVAKYAWLGIVPVPIPSLYEDVPIPTRMLPRHVGNDLEYVRYLADNAGHIFIIEPGPAPGMNRAYWGPEVRVGAPQPALNVDMDAHTNVESLSFRYEADNAVLPILYIQTKTPPPTTIKIPVPAATPLMPPLGLVPPVLAKRYPLKVAKLNTAQAVMKALGYVARHSDVVFADGTLDVLRYGRTLKARKLVGVRGAGMAFDGLYYVRSVTHDIKPGKYTQSFTLARNGLVSTVPRVAA